MCSLKVITTAWDCVSLHATSEGHIVPKYSDSTEVILTEEANPDSFPFGLTYLNSLSAAPFNQRRSLFDKSLSGAELRLLGDSMSALQQMAQCHPRCTSKTHVVEALLGRAFNNACAALLLAQSGLYDECLSMIRGIGECANLVMLIQSVRPEGEKWWGMSAEDQWREFSPAKVRKKMRAHNVPIPMEEVEYAELCGHVHTNKGTRPNNHSDGNQVGFLFGIHQEKAYAFAISRITEHVSTMALLGSKMTSRDDLWTRLKRTIDVVSAVGEKDESSK
jgi:hypothetical protein